MEQMETAKELMELEREYWQAMKEGDGEAAAELTDETCLVAGPRGIGRIKRQDIPSMVESTSTPLKDFKFKDIEVTALTKDVGVVAYTVNEDLTVDGKPFSMEAAESSTWVRRGDHWLCALHCEAPKGDAFGRPRA